MRRPDNPPGEPLVIVISLGNRPQLALFPCRQFPSMVPNPECLTFKIITNQTMSRFILVFMYIYISLYWFINECIT